MNNIDKISRITIVFKKLCYHLTDIFYLIFLRDNNGLNWRKAFDMKN